MLHVCRKGSNKGRKTRQFTGVGVLEEHGPGSYQGVQRPLAEQTWGHSQSIKMQYKVRFNVGWSSLGLTSSENPKSGGRFNRTGLGFASVCDKVDGTKHAWGEWYQACIYGVGGHTFCRGLFVPESTSSLTITSTFSGSCPGFGPTVMSSEWAAMSLTRSESPLSATQPSPSLQSLPTHKYMYIDGHKPFSHVSGMAGASSANANQDSPRQNLVGRGNIQNRQNLLGRGNIRHRQNLVGRGNICHRVQTHSFDRRSVLQCSTRHLKPRRIRSEAGSTALTLGNVSRPLRAR